MSFLLKFVYKPPASGETRDSSFDTDEDETKGFMNGAQTRHGDQQKASRRTVVLLTVLNACVLLLSFTLFTTWFYNRHNVLNADYRRVSAYSPVHDRFDLDPSIKKIDGTFYRPKDGGSIARQQPNPDADAIWDEWELTRVYPVTRTELTKMGKDWTTAAKLEDDVWDLGDDAYAAIFDIYHQVHCLNSLRHMAYGEYYNLSMARAHMIKHREIHINHCIDILLQGIQCSGNLDLIPLHWMETQEYPFPDMSINKQCVNFDKFTDWRKANTIDMEKYVKAMHMPEGEKPGIKQLPAADQYYEYWGYENPNHKPKEEGGHGIPLDIDSNL
jgi:hypothetical protein